MSNDPTLADVKQMLNDMLRVYRPGQQKINKQKNIDKKLDYIYTKVLRECASHGLEAWIINPVLLQLQFSGHVENYMITESGDCFRVQVTIPFDSAKHLMLFCPEHFPQDYNYE